MNRENLNFSFLLLIMSTTLKRQNFVSQVMLAFPFEDWREAACCFLNNGTMSRNVKRQVRFSEQFIKMNVDFTSHAISSLKRKQYRLFYDLYK